MPVWHRKVNIHQHLGDDVTPEAASQMISEELKQAGVVDEDLQDLLCDLLWAGYDDDVEWFDDVLEDIYTWGDRNRVWLGESVGGTS